MVSPRLSRREPAVLCPFWNIKHDLHFPMCLWDMLFLAIFYRTEKARAFRSVCLRLMLLLSLVAISSFWRFWRLIFLIFIHYLLLIVEKFE